MALNVYSTIFHKYNSKQLRRLEWKYAVGCYGLPFIPAFVYFFIHTPARGRVYSQAIVRLHTSHYPLHRTSNSHSHTDIVLSLHAMGLSPHRCLIWAGLVRHPSHIRHIYPRWLSDIPKTTTNPCTPCTGRYPLAQFPLYTRQSRRYPGLP
jgi:hypothetical protein